MASLALSNKHLSTRAKREKAVQLTVATSSAIEGIRAPFKGAKAASKGKTIKAPGKAPVKSPKRAPSA
jgi:hypothetical protein